MEKLNINGRLIGPGELPYYIAEVGSNHNGDMNLCRQLIDAAKKAGADAVKFQSWSKKSLISTAEYARNTSYADAHRHFGTLAAMVEKYQFTPDQHREMAAYCTKVGITFASSPFSNEEVDLLDELNTPFLKIASMDINHLPLLKYAGSKRKPVLLSTGMATLGEIERALLTLRRAGSGPVAVMHCISIYPPKIEEINLRNIPTFQQAFDVPVGFSDHSIGTTVSLGAVALGACVIEKHFTLDKTMAGWDHWISADAPEMETLVREGRALAAALGSGVRSVSDIEIEKRKAFRRRIVTARHVPAGKILEWADMDYKRPGTGIGPDEAEYVLGRRVKHALQEDHELEWDDVI